MWILQIKKEKRVFAFIFVFFIEICLLQKKKIYLLGNNLGCCKN